MAVIVRPNVKETTATTGTGTYSLGGAATGFFTFLAQIGNGGQCYYVVSNGVDKEFGIGTVVTGTPVTLQRTSVLASTNGGAAVNWGGGTKDAYCDDLGYDRLLAANNLSDLADVAAAAQTLGLRPAGQSGGTDGKIVRLSAANTWTDASNADTLDQLALVAFRVGGRYLPAGSPITGLSGLSAFTTYYLGTGGAITSTAPTPSSTVRRLCVGRSMSTTSLLFCPGIPIGG